MGVKALRKIQWGFETTAGTAVAATQIYRGMGVLTDETEIVIPDEDIGIYMRGDRYYMPKESAVLEMDEVPATFEQLPIILSCAVEGLTTGAADGSGSGKIYQYDMPTTASQAIKTVTIEMGDDQRVDEMEYAFVESWTLSGASGEAVMMSANWRGKQATDAEFTTGLNPPTVEEILFNKGKLYIDTSGGTIGTTQKTTTWMGFSLEFPNGWRPVWTADGSVTWSDFAYVGHKDEQITGTLTLRHDATGEAEITAARAGNGRLVRMLFQGSALTTAGTAYTYKTCQVDLAIRYTSVPPLSDEDGLDTVELPFEVYWNSAKSLGGQIIVVPALATLGV